MNLGNEVPGLVDEDAWMKHAMGEAIAQDRVGAVGGEIREVPQARNKKWRESEPRRDIRAGDF